MTYGGNRRRHRGIPSMTLLSSEMRTARKRHRCQLCWRDIEPGEKYRHQVSADAGTIGAFKNCAHCDQLVSIPTLRDWAFYDGISWQEISGWEPETIAEARLKVRWRKGWKRPDGTLIPVPGSETQGDNTDGL